MNLHTRLQALPEFANPARAEQNVTRVTVHEKKKRTCEVNQSLSKKVPEGC
jgi:hypothetical protein